MNMKIHKKNDKEESKSNLEQKVSKQIKGQKKRILKMKISFDK